jgi:phosphoribosyl 1,2-cyclic phosphodiesterase
MSFFVKFWGCRGSIPTPGARTQKYGGNTSCVEARIDDALFVCDGGTGLRDLGTDLMARGKKGLVGHMFFSHSHWDHIQGFPFFVPAYVPSNTFHVYRAAPGATDMYRLLSGQMHIDYFPVDFKDLRSNILASSLSGGASGEIDGTRVVAFEQRHPGTSWGFSFEKCGHKVVYATDNEIDLTLPQPEAVEKDLDAPRRVPEAFLAFIRDADLLIADGQYTEAEYPAKVGWGQPRVTTVVDAAVQANVKQLAVYHHDPMHSDRDVDDKLRACVERAKRFDSRLSIFGAREGMELRID